MPAKAHTQVPANPKSGPLLERLILERRPVLERIASRMVRPDQVDDAIQAACLGFLRAFDPTTAVGGEDGAFRYLARAVDNSAAKIIRGETRLRRGLPPAAPASDEDDPVACATDLSADPVEFVLGQEELFSRLQRLAELPTDQRRALILRVAGYEPAEIEAALGLTSRQYRKRIEKAKRRLADSA